MIQAGCAKAFKSAWMEQDQKSTSNKMMWHREINFLTQYYELKKIHD